MDPVFSDPSGYQGPTLALAAVFFTFQIYCDFSGYSDIAIGAARILGYDSMDNFHSPYFSRSIPEFWRRWHISLSTWFRDYLYIPLGGKRTSLPRWYLNLFLVFLISGLWHGSNWTFVVWGGLHGLYYIGSVVTSPLRKRASVVTGFEKQVGLHHAAQIVITFMLVAFAWIFFRAATISDAFTMVTGLSAGWNSGLSVALGPFLSKAEFIIGLGSLSVLGIARLLSTTGSIGQTFCLRPRWCRWALYTVVYSPFSFLATSARSRLSTSSFKRV